MCGPRQQLHLNKVELSHRGPIKIANSASQSGDTIGQDFHPNIIGKYHREAEFGSQK